MLGGPSKVFTRKAVVDKTHLYKFTNVCNSINGIDASQHYSYSMCEPMRTELYTRYADFQKLKARQNKSRSFENMVQSYFQRT